MKNILSINNYSIIKNIVIIIIFIIIIIVFITNNYKNEKTKKINWYIFVIVPFIILFYYIVKYILIFKTDIGKQYRTSNCLMLGYNFLLNKQNLPIEIAKPHLLNMPFNEFIISTSHNTYIPCLQNFDVVSVDAIKNALMLGARVIELDVYAKNNVIKNDDSYIPIVAHGIESPLVKKGYSRDIFTTSYIYFEDCIKTISEFANQTSDPIWIDLEINTNKIPQTQQKMKDILVKYFGKKLLNNELNKINHFTKEPIKNLLNKIIITSCKPKSEIINKVSNIPNELSTVINSYRGGYYRNTENKDKKLININPSGIIQRIYPAGNLLGHFSYNYDPEPFWKNKYQLVALNFQTYDEHLIKNMTMFKYCSFVHFSELNLNKTI